MELKAGYKQTEIGVIPEDWEPILLDEVTRRGSGHTPDKKYSKYWNGDINWVSLKDSAALDNSYISSTTDKVTQLGIDNSSAVVHPKETVILSRDAGVGKSAILAKDMAVSQHFIAWQCQSRIYNVFLYYWLQSKKPEFERIANGNTIKTIGLPFFKTLKIPLPRVEEQTAIATALSDVDALLSKLDALIAKKRNLKQAAMQQLLTAQIRLPGFSGEWEVKRLGEFGATYGGLTGKTKVDFGSGEARYITFMNIMKNVRISTDILETVQVSQSEVQNRVKKGDLFFNGSSETPEEVGLCSVLTNELQDVYLNSFCFGFRPKADAHINGQYFAYFFRSDEGRELLKALAQGATRYNLSKTALMRVSFPIPSFEEQTAVATVLSDMDADITTLEARREKTSGLKQGMMQELLTGKTRLI